MNNKSDKNINEIITNSTILKESEIELIYNQNYVSENYQNSKKIIQNLIKNDVVYRYDSENVKPYKNRKKFIIHSESNLINLFKNKDGIIISCWNTDILANYTSMQLMKTLYFVETYSYMQEIVLNILLENKYPAVLEKDFAVVSKYYLSDRIYIIKSINEDSPIVRKNNSTNITTPKIEKILVDLYNDDILNNIYSSEINHIYKEILTSYAVNIKTMFRYAKKKYVLEELKQYLTSIGFDIEIGEFK